MDSYDILVIILSSALAVLLIVSIIFMVVLVKVIRRVNEIVEKAGSVIDNVQSATQVLKNSAAPVAISKIVSNIIDLMKERNKGDED